MFRRLKWLSVPLVSFCIGCGSGPSIESGVPTGATGGAAPQLPETKTDVRKAMTRGSLAPDMPSTPR